MNQPLLEGRVEPSADDDLRDRVAELENEVASLRHEIKTMGRENAKVIARLLSPLWKALEPIFGELADVGVAEAAPPNSRATAWESVKARLQPRHRQVIDVLLLQGEMTRRQISSAIQMNYNNCTNNVIGPLLRQGWLIEVGGKIALKQL